MKKRMIITMALAGTPGVPRAHNNSINDKHARSATAISRVLGDRREAGTIVLEYDTPIGNKRLPTESSRVSRLQMKA